MYRIRLYNQRTTRQQEIQSLLSTNNGAKQSRTKTHYLPVIYIDQDGVIYSHQQLQDYDYKKHEEWVENDYSNNQHRVQTYCRIEVYGRTAKQGRLF